MQNLKSNFYKLQKRYYRETTKPVLRVVRKSKFYKLQKRYYRETTKPILKVVRESIIKKNIFSIKSKRDLRQQKIEIKAEKKIIKVNGAKFLNNSINTPHKQQKKINVLSPEIKLNHYKNVYIFGKTCFITKKKSKTLYLDDVVKKEDDLAAVVDGNLKKIGDKHFFNFKCNNKKYENGILLSGQCSGNYAHWITELLPKICYVDSDPNYSNFPLVIDNWDHPVFEKTAHLVSKYKRTVIKVDKYERILFKNLIDVSAVSYIPVKPVNRNDFLSPYQFSKDALDRLRIRILNIVNNDCEDLKGQKLFLKRKKVNTGNNRLLLNSIEIEKIAIQKGYTVIDPGDFSFEDQVRIIANATHIISPIGAALSNLVFNGNNCKVIVLSPHYKNCDFRFFSSLLGVLGHSVEYILGTQKVEKNIPIENRSYYISETNFRDLVRGR